MQSHSAITAAVAALSLAASLWAATVGGTQATGEAERRVITIPATAPSAPAPSPVVSVPPPATATSNIAPTLSVAAGMADTVAAKPMPGVNLSGGEFGSSGSRIWYGYTYPNAKEIAHFAAKGFKIVRMPFRWERLQPTIYGPLSVPDRNALKASVDKALSLGLVVVLDMHNFGQRGTPANGTQIVGSAYVTDDALVDAWVKIMEDYRGQPNVWIGMMNEPNRQTADAWWKSANVIARGIRKQRIKNRLMVPGTAWTGAHSWFSSGNASRAEAFVDPANNFAFEVHQYLDAYSSGTQYACKAGAGARMDAVIAWAEKRKVKLFAGEIAGSGDAQCAIEYPRMLQRLNASPAVIGWTAWGGGSWWNKSYIYRLPSDDTTTTPHMTMLLANLPK